jgi:hypothetical protein
MTPKVVFIGQPAYFLQHVTDRVRGYNAKFLEYLHMITPPEDLSAADDADIRVCFRAEYIPVEVTTRWAKHGLTLAISTEPIPFFAGEPPQLETSEDRANRFSELINARSRFDGLWHYAPESIPYLDQFGFEVKGVFRLPVNLQAYKPQRARSQTWDVFLFGKETVYRQHMSNPLKHALGSRFCHVTHGFVGDDFVRLANRSLIGLNLHVDPLPATEPRLALYAACGLCIVSEPLGDNTLWQPGVNYVEANGQHEVTEKVLYYLKHESEREGIAQRGLNLVREHFDAEKVWPTFLNEVRERKGLPAPEEKVNDIGF